MIADRSDRFRLFSWCLAVFFTLVSIPHFDLIAIELTDLIGTVAYAAEDQADPPAVTPESVPNPAISSEHGQNDNVNNQPSDKPQDDPAKPSDDQSKPKPGDGTSQTSSNDSNAIPEAMLFTGAASYRVPIAVPPGRAVLGRLDNWK